MKDYLIEDFTDVSIAGEGEPTIRVVDEKELWNFLQSLKSKPREISVFEIGDCLLDWS